MMSFLGIIILIIIFTQITGIEEELGMGCLMGLLQITAIVAFTYLGSLIHPLVGIVCFICGILSLGIE